LSKNEKNKNRLTGKWDITECNLDGIGRLGRNEYYPSIIFEFNASAPFKSFYIKTDGDTITNSANWSVRNDELIVTYTEGSTEILMLTNDFSKRDLNFDILELTKETSFELESIVNGRSLQIVGEYMEEE